MHWDKPIITAINFRSENNDEEKQTLANATLMFRLLLPLSRDKAQLL